MIKKDRGYQRTHLRAPYNEVVLFEADDFVHKTETINISEGGLLLTNLPTFPAEELTPMMLALPQMPYFKNYSLDKLKDYDQSLLSKKVIRAKSQMVRRMGATSNVHDAFIPKIGVKFTDIEPASKKIIKEYVDVFSSNIIYLQVIIDSINADVENRDKVYFIAKYLGYDPEMKIAELRRIVAHDYISLQWL